MEIDSALVKRAKKTLGDDNALWIAQLLNIADFDTQRLKARCPFHQEDTASFIYDRKRFTFHCFGCLKNVDIIDALIYTGKTYAEACQELFKRANISYNFGMLGVKSLGRDYRYPTDVPEGDMSATYDYLKTRGISKQTIMRAGIRQDAHGNMAFRYIDANDVLTMVKYRPSRMIKRGESKMWCQSGSDTKPLLYNMHRVNASAPLLICEGEIDCLSAIEAGYLNSVSVPLGAGNLHWIEENWEWLEQFESIILCGDNDKPGQTFMRDAAYRLGSWRTKFVDLPEAYTNADGETYAIKDINDTLVYYGPEKVMDCITRAKDAPVMSVTDFVDIADEDIDEQDGLYLGIKEIDKEISKLNYGTFNILTGINGCVDCSTQYFNGTRWRNISEYQEGDQVLVYNADGTVHLEYPAAYIKRPCDEMLQFSAYGVNQVVTPDHTMVFEGRERICRMPADMVKKQCGTTKNGFYGRFVQTFKVSDDERHADISDDALRLFAVVALRGLYAPGYFASNGIMTVPIPEYHKSMGILALLERLDIPYRIKLFNKKNAVEFKSPWGTRQVPDVLWDLSARQYAVLYDALSTWCYRDEKYAKYAFRSDNKERADFIQFVYATQGIATRLNIIAVQDEFGQTRYNYGLFTLGVKLAGKLPPTSWVAKVKPADGYKYCFTVSSGMWVSRRMGVINVTGNSGKSSFLSQVICQCLEQGRDAWLYSKELPNPMAKNWIQHVFAGPHHLEEKRDARGRTYWNVPKDIKLKVNDFYRGRLYIYKEGCPNKPDDLLESMEASARKYGCKLFVIDNLTAISLGNSENDKWDRQNEFVTRLIDFAQKYNVVVLLVIHPRKLDIPRKLTKMDVQGSGGMVDLSHRTFSLYRVSQKDREGVKSYRGDGWKVPPIKYDVIFGILKDRYTGCEGAEIGLYFHRPSMRFFTDADELNYSYGWDKPGIDKKRWIYPKQLTEDDLPF